MKPKFILFIPAVIWIIIVFVLLVMPGSDIPSNDFFEMIYFDKWVHVGLFGLLTIFWGFPFLRLPETSAKTFIVIALLATFYGALMEFVQKYYTSSRNFDVTDIIADFTGAAIAAFILIKMRKRFNVEEV